MTAGSASDDTDVGMAVATRLQCARQFLTSLLPEPTSGKPVPLVEDLIFAPEAQAMLHALNITVRSPEGVVCAGPNTDHTFDDPATLGTAYAAGSIQVRHMGRVICTLHACSHSA